VSANRGRGECGRAPRRGPVRLLFVDGNHERASVEADVDAWLPFLVPGGFLLLHDSTDLSSYAGPTAVARERMCVGPVFDLVGTLGGTTWARRAGAAESWHPDSPGARTIDGALRTIKRFRAARATQSV